jgi:hypothetical protein
MFSLEDIKIYYFKENDWNELIYSFKDNLINYKDKDLELNIKFDEINENIYSYNINFNSNFYTMIKLELNLKNKGFHLIPSVIYGDNNLSHVDRYEYPFLANKDENNIYASPYLSFRADRASAPISILSTEEEIVGISIEPYIDNDGIDVYYGRQDDNLEDGIIYPYTKNIDFVHNGLFSKLDNSFGVTLGYMNYPYTFKNKKMIYDPTANFLMNGSTKGYIYHYDKGLSYVDLMIRNEYKNRCDRALFKNDDLTAIKAIKSAFQEYNFDKSENEFTNRKCKPKDDTIMKPWREVTEIGWTGGAILAYPLIMAQYALNMKDDYNVSGERIIDRIIDSYNPNSHLFYNCVKEKEGCNKNSSGWFVGHTKDPNDHYAYTLGSATYYILKTIIFMKEHNLKYKDNWLIKTTDVLNKVKDNIKEDGKFGYSFSSIDGHVTDHDGFAGCWFVPSFVLLYKLTNDNEYLDIAKKGIEAYHPYVRDLNVYGTPMDTQKATDEEGNLAFMKGARLLHEVTGEAKYLTYLKQSASYEFLWRYCYKSRPDFKPIDHDWSSCGGSITSISNPHIHPMGLIIDSELRYLYKETNDEYYLEREKDSYSWMMQNLEMYPNRTGFGRYGIMTERWCPSDGLTIETYSDKSHSSIWFSYNLWAPCCCLEELLEKYFENK